MPAVVLKLKSLSDSSGNSYKKFKFLNNKLSKIFKLKKKQILNFIFLI